MRGSGLLESKLSARPALESPQDASAQAGCPSDRRQIDGELEGLDRAAPHRGGVGGASATDLLLDQVGARNASLLARPAP